MPDRWGFPNLGTGLAIVSQHYAHVLANPVDVDFFEVISENFMQTEGYPLYFLDRLTERWPVILHGVGLSIGGLDPIERDYLRRLKALAARTRSRFVSDHLCWTGYGGHVTHDTLPVPPTEEALANVVSRVRMVQDYLEMPLVLENTSAYIEYAAEMPEWEFLARLAEAADCGLLVDVTSVYVSARNHGIDPIRYLDALPLDRIVYHHLAGYSDHGGLLKCTLSDRVVPDVWRLFGHIQSRTGGRSTLIEWDTAVPEFAVLQEEVDKLRRCPAQPIERSEAVETSKRPAHRRPAPLRKIYAGLHRHIVSNERTPDRHADVYRNQYWTRMSRELGYYFPRTCDLVGIPPFARLAVDYVQRHPPDHYNIFRLRDRFPVFLRRRCPPMVADVARVEKLMRDLGDEPDVPLAIVTSDGWYETRLRLRPTVRVLKLRFHV